MKNLFVFFTDMHSGKKYANTYENWETISWVDNQLCVDGMVQAILISEITMIFELVDDEIVNAYNPND